MNKLLKKIAIPLLSISLVACGAGTEKDLSGTQQTDDNITTSNDTVEQVLSDLGIDTTASKRLDIDGDELPESYAPFGSRKAINKFSEIMLFGVPAKDNNISTAGNKMSITNLLPVANNRYSWELLHDEPVSNTPWFDTDLRSSVTGDFDGDGIDEILIVYQIKNEDVKFVVMQDSTQGYDVSSPVTVNTNSWSKLFVSAGDFDGNSSEDVIIGMTGFTGNSKLVMLQNDNGSLNLNGMTIDIDKVMFNNTQLAMASGNLDFDNALELAVAVNESNGYSQYFVFDDANSNFAVLKNDQLTVDNGAGSSLAVVTNVAVGDIDGDSIDEVVLAGLDKSGKISSSDSRDTYYMIKVLDDAKHDLTQLAEKYTPSGAIKLKYSAATQFFNYVQVITADIDGDGAKEIAVNQNIYNSLRKSPNALINHDEDDDPSNGVSEISMINWAGIKERNYVIDWNTTAIAAADVTLDKRENIVIYSQRNAGTTRNSPQQELQVWGLDQINGWSKMASYENDRRSGTTTRYYPQILLPDLELDDGSATLSFSEGSHRLIFTEPMIIAALAAAPCDTKLGQDLGESCRTSFGSAISSSNSTTNGWSFTSGGSVGYDGKIPFTNSGLEVIASAQETLRGWNTSAYKLTKTVTRETGAIEDSVILTSIPMDVYSYTILSHPDQNLVGSTVQVRLPREMITVMVTIDFYNKTMMNDGVKIDENIFNHTSGNPASYPNASEKNQLLNTYNGLQSNELSTGEGTGQTIASIAEFTSSSNGNSYEFNATLDVRATTGAVVGGFTVGKGSESALEITRGNETIYQGSVGNITASAFQQGQDYNWGLFSYIYKDQPSGQTFEVLNYWVD